MDPYESEFENVSESSSPKDLSEAEETDKKPVKKKRFSNTQVTRLNFYYNSGMKGVGKRYLGLITRASADTHLTKEQVMVCITTICFRMLVNLSFEPKEGTVIAYRKVTVHEESLEYGSCLTYSHPRPGLIYIPAYVYMFYLKYWQEGSGI